MLQLLEGFTKDQIYFNVVYYTININLEIFKRKGLSDNLISIFTFRFHSSFSI